MLVSSSYGHRDEIGYSERHFKEWLLTKEQLEYLFENRFEDVDFYGIVGKNLINRFRIGIHDKLFDGRIAIGWPIYLTTSRFNHSCQPDLLQCSYDINMRLTFVNNQRKIPETALEFDRLTVSYRHQNDFRLTNPLTYVPTRRQRRKFVSFFFFNCHCVICADDLRNRYAESATNRLCNQCGDFLVLQNLSHHSNRSILTCLQTDRITERINLSLIDDDDDHHQQQQSIEIYEDKLHQIEQLLHSQSFLLLQQGEKLYFTYQHFFKNSHLTENQRIHFIHRITQLGEVLIQSYDIHLTQSSILS